MTRPRRLSAPRFIGTRPGGPSSLRAGGLPMRELAAILTPLAGRLVLDRTGLDGVYDFELTWTADEVSSPPLADAAAAPSLFTALHEQLRLRLTGERGAVDVPVIDHVEEAETTDGVVRADGSRRAGVRRGRKHQARTVTRQGAGAAV